MCTIAARSVDPQCLIANRRIERYAMRFGDADETSKRRLHADRSAARSTCQSKRRKPHVGRMENPVMFRKVVFCVISLISVSVPVAAQAPATPYSPSLLVGAAW